jgi:hypothetical protein
MAGGDIDAALRLARLRDSLRVALSPCITLCPIGHGFWKPYRGKVPRGKYVSIFLSLGDWRDLPRVTTRYSIKEQLKNDFFLRTLKEHRKTA